MILSMYMIDMSFDFILSYDVLLYRSTKIREHLLGQWYCFIPEHTFGYGPITGEFKTTKSLKLLDITKNSFYNDFKDKIIDCSKSNHLVNDNKMPLLFPLGFTDAIIYTKFADEIRFPRVSTIDLVLELDTQYYGNRSRCSILQLDLQLILVLKELYSDYDGIISPVNLPNILMNGRQHSEMCVFNKDNIILIKELPRVLQSGGGMKSSDDISIVGAISLDNEFTRDYTKAMKDFSKTFKPLSNYSIIEQHNIQHNFISSITKSRKISTNYFNKKHRKTRKKIKYNI